MAKPLVTAIFELSHSRLRLALLSESLNEVSFYESPISGYVKGKVTNQNSLTQSIAALVNSAGLPGVRYMSHVVVPALHTRTIIRSIEHRTTGVYRSCDFAAIQDAALDSASTDLDEAIDCLPLSFKLDGQDFDPQSYGRRGKVVSAKFMMFVYPRILLADFVAAFNMAGLEVSSFMAASRGVASCLLSLRREAENAVLIDVGQSTTTGAIMIGGNLHDVFSLPVGGAHMTNDMAIGLGLDFAECERIKIDRGLLPNAAPSTPSDHVRYLRPRVVELCTLISKPLSLYAKSLDGGIMLCGGASLLRGFSGELSRVLSVPSPFVCQLTRTAIEVFFPNVSIQRLPDQMTSGYLGLIANAASLSQTLRAKNFELESRPLSRLRPLWAWLSELSR
jgi:cell division ATPase FtsA